MVQNSTHAVSSVAVVSSPVRRFAPALRSFAALTLVRRIPYVAVGASLIVLAWFSLRLAANRIFQVDECTNIFVAHAIAAGQTHVLGAIDLFQIPLALVAGGNSRAIDIYVSGRFVMIEIFWLNVILMAIATGEKLFSRRGALALFGAATLTPMWDYGFEIRHDNLLLTGVLLIWCFVRQGKVSMQAFFALGVVSVALQFVAFKAFVYTVPIAIGALVFGRREQGLVRWKLLIMFVLGALLAFCGVRLVYGYCGVWGIYMHGAQWVTGVSTSGSHRFAPWLTLQRLPQQTPLLLALCVAASISLASTFLKRGTPVSIWQGMLPNFLLLLVSFAALAANPTPFPYNLVLLAPFLYLFAFRYAAGLFQAQTGPAATEPAIFWRQSTIAPLAATIVIFTHLVPFGIATARHLQYPNTRQDLVMTLSEKLTDPARDPVCDGTGMVPTRPIVHPEAFLHRLTIGNLLHENGVRFHHLMASNPPAVFIPSYRTDPLPEEDHAYVRNHYVSLADDFWILGTVLPSGGGRFEILHSGRYRISTLADSDLAGTYPDGIKGLLTPEADGKISGTLDGRELATQVLELAVGSHQFTCASNLQPALVWVGPRADRPHRFSGGDHKMLFVNWY